MSESRVADGTRRVNKRRGSALRLRLRPRVEVEARMVGKVTHETVRMAGNLLRCVYILLSIWCDV